MHTICQLQMQLAQNAKIKRLISGQDKQGQVMKQKQNSLNVLSANIFGEFINNSLINNK